jgi:hypothetical protein
MVMVRRIGPVGATVEISVLLMVALCEVAAQNRAGV